jgi:hypothetical protein
MWLARHGSRDWLAYLSPDHMSESIRARVLLKSTLNGFSDTCHANKIHDRVNSNLLTVQPRAREIRIS